MIPISIKMSSSSAKVISNQSDIKVNREHFSIFNQIYINLGIRSTKNTSEMLRVSCDTRWQRADQPIDPRLMFIMIRDDTNDNWPKVNVHDDDDDGTNDNWPKARSSDGRNDINNIESVTWQLTQSDREGDTNIDHEGDDNDKLINTLLIKFNFDLVLFPDEWPNWPNWYYRWQW